MWEWRRPVKVCCRGSGGSCCRRQPVRQEERSTPLGKQVVTCIRKAAAAAASSGSRDELGPSSGSTSCPSASSACCCCCSRRPVPKGSEELKGRSPTPTNAAAARVRHVGNAMSGRVEHHTTRAAADNCTDKDARTQYHCIAVGPLQQGKPQKKRAALFSPRALAACRGALSLGLAVSPGEPPSHTPSRRAGSSDGNAYTSNRDTGCGLQLTRGRTTQPEPAAVGSCCSSPCSCSCSCSPLLPPPAAPPSASFASTVTRLANALDAPLRKGLGRR